MIKIAVGCGKRNYGPDWYHVDGDKSHTHLYGFDITQLLFNNDSVDLIYASHILEYFDREEVIPVLKEWQRVLRPGGILRIAVPNFMIMAKLYMDGRYQLKDFLGPLYGRMQMDDKWIYHKTCYDAQDLFELLSSIGMKKLRRYNWWETEHKDIDDCASAYLPKMDKENGILISLNVEAEK